MLVRKLEHIRESLKEYVILRYEDVKHAWERQEDM